MAWIKRVYLYMVSLISLIILVIAGIILINLGLKTWVFTKADNNYYAIPKVICQPVGAPNAEGGTYRDPSCDDPNYQEKELALQKDERTAQKQRDASQAIAMILVASPVFYYHWKLARKEV